MHAQKNTTPQLRWALPTDLDKVPESVIRMTHATAHMALLTLGLSVTATVLLLAAASPLALLPAGLALTSAGALFGVRSGLLALPRVLLILATAACAIVFLARFNPSALDALALAPAALILAIRGRERPTAVMIALVFPLALTALLRSVGTPQAVPDLIYALAPLSAAALVSHALWRRPIKTSRPATQTDAPKLVPSPVVKRHAPAPGQPLRVLVVDDIPINRMVVQRMLQAKGLTVLEAGSGEEALELLKNNDVDLVFLDLHMPGLDGIEVARRIRARGDRVPLVALTADSVAGTREACLAAGMDAFLTKPAPPQVLFQLVEGLTLLQQRSAS
ncbi:MAG: CheY-like chemotaxis protein [Cognaticolwellia sp.]|jgi:CheY-like chemotaxis protein